MAGKPTVQVGIRFSPEIIGKVRAYRNDAGLETDADAVRELVVRGLAQQSSDDPETSGFDAGYQNGHAEGLRTIIKAVRTVIGQHEGEFKLLWRLVLDTVDKMNKKAGGGAA